MAKMIFPLGFWMTIVLLIVLGYALSAVGYSFGADCAGPMNCGDGQSAIASVLSDENQSLQSDLRAGDISPGSKGAPNGTLRGNISDFPQMANLQAGGPTYAPGLSLTIASRLRQVSLCPGAIEIPRH